MTAQEVADALTSGGLEVDGVEEVQSIKGGLEGIVVGEVLTCEVHPNSDHMHVTTVNLGSGDPVQIVCGAPNVAAGQKVMVATLGCKLYDGDECFTIKKSKLRGIESNGMICAEDEIGVGTSHDGIIVLPEDTVPGTPAAQYYNLESDYVIEVDITPNRADACSHYGVARDLYAYLVQNGYKTALHRPDVDAFKVDSNDLPISVEVEATEACPRYCAVSLKNCEVKESPKWLQDKLNVIGLRPINNIVDITNYIMMAYGQPLHCFDADMIKGGKVVVKTMPEGTPFVTLDGVEHKLSDKDLAICNAEEPMCIAGVFGGKGSGTYEATKNAPPGRAYAIHTAVRKGQIYALKMAALMAKELAGAEVSMEIVDVNPTPAKNFNVDLSYDYCDRLIGKKLERDTIKSICQSLEMKITEETADGIKLEVPAYRVDVQRPCDVVEDILRIYGYNNVEIPMSMNSCIAVKGDNDKSHKLQNLVSEQLVGCGFNEILNNSLTKASYYEMQETCKAENCVRLLNPLSNDLSVLRQTLLFGGLESIARNANYRMPNQRFFEFGNCYYFNEEKRCADIVPGVSSSRDPEVIKHMLDAYSEDYHLGIWVTGKRVEGSWAHADEDSSFAELKAYVMNVLNRCGVPFGMLVFAPLQSDLFDKALEIQNRGGKSLVKMGVVSYKMQKQFDIDAPVYFADINWKLLMKLIKNVTVTYKEISKFPAVSRDLALLLDKGVEFAEIEKIAYSTEKKLLKEVRLFDVYEGKNLPAGKKSYAVNFILQDAEKTLNEKQIDQIMQKLIKNLTSTLSAELR